MPEVQTGNSVTVKRAAQWKLKNGSNLNIWNLYKNTDSRPHPGNALGPVNFLFDTPPAEMGTTQTLPNARTEMNWLAGCKFTVASGKQLTVTHLGRYRCSSNTRKHEVRIIRATSDLVTMAQTVVDMSLSSPTSMIYEQLQTPVRLTAGDYYLVSREFQANNPDELFYGDANTAASTPLLKIELPSVVQNVHAGYFTYDSNTSVINSTWQDKPSWTNRC